MSEGVGSIVDSEKFYGALRDAVNQVRADRAALELAEIDSAANLRAVIHIRRHRDELSALIAKRPEEFAGLLVALAAQVYEQGARIQSLQNRFTG